MLKIKERVNQNLGIALWISLFLLSSPVFAGEAGFYFAEREGREFRVLEHKNPKLQPAMGSLLKPFAAWYLLEHGIDGAQTVFCPPERKRTTALRCWTPEGHGAMTLQQAIVQSCNYYFLLRFQGIRLGDYETWLRSRFDWPEDLPIRKPENVYGFDLPRGIDAAKIASMYSLLLNEGEKGNANARIVVEGLRDICQGTLKEFCRRFAKLPRFRLILGKTGTAQEGKKNFGIALIYAEYLPQNKKILLLCYEKNKMGSEAALNALKILDDYDRKTRKGTGIHR